MRSAALRHFPPVVFLPKGKVLWNRFEKKPLANRPEERVRLRYLDHLTLEGVYPGSRIRSEAVLDTAPGKRKENRKSRLRADLICYNSRFEPELLIECKAESVPLNQKAALQIALYNRSVQAPRLCITNGLVDYWFEQCDGKIRPAASAAVKGNGAGSGSGGGPDYWMARGFAGRHAEKNLPGLAGLLNEFWSGDALLESRYLDITQPVDSFWMNHYYRLIHTDRTHRLAVTFLAGSSGETALVAILNRDGKNQGVLVVRLDELAAGKEENALLLSASGRKHPDLRGGLPFDLQGEERNLQELPGVLLELFRNNL